MFAHAFNFATFASRFGGGVRDTGIEVDRLKKGVFERKRLAISHLRKNLKKLEKKFWKAKKFPTFATRYGGNDERKTGRLDERDLK